MDSYLRLEAEARYDPRNVLVVQWHQYAKGIKSLELALLGVSLLVSFPLPIEPETDLQKQARELREIDQYENTGRFP